MDMTKHLSELIANGYKIDDVVKVKKLGNGIMIYISKKHFDRLEDKEFYLMSKDEGFILVEK